MPRTGRRARDTDMAGVMDFNSILIGSENPERLSSTTPAARRAHLLRDGGYTGWQLGSGFVTVGPHSEVKGKNAHPGRIIWNIESTDVQGDFERFKAAGATVIAEPYSFESDPVDTSIATFADPDDNYFQLMSPMDPNEMGGG